MYESLSAQCKNFHLYVFAFDDKCTEFLKKTNPERMTVIPLSEFEDEELLRIKPSRTRGEYCWTATPSAILYVIEKFGADHCTYLDADLYFFSSPLPLINELGSRSILITSHRYSPQFDMSARSGKYCVQFVTFRSNKDGIEALQWWRKACLEWCFDRFENGKFGDQKYLDDWTERFPNVHVLQNLGGGVAPWNMQQYRFEIHDGRPKGFELKSRKQFDVIFFHFHFLQFVSPSIFVPYYK
jgi:hypothetical protein